ncbi:hypothetical protein FOL47_009599 [Perkinsus chesapeaki]|uniref:Uncharacterized protein n=1 Tax=Perkinsus chesapeaki TaxID=330153 RepID=A0A7J6MRK2_PERCH|nr:hypothetical protein FOL47_009599 [Perkinsus chesapeaki]
MASITACLSIIFMVASVVCEPSQYLGHTDYAPAPFTDKDLIKLVAGRTFRTKRVSEGYTKKITLAFDTLGEQIQVRMTMSSKALHPKRKYISPWVQVKFSPHAVGEISLKASAKDLDAFRQFKQNVSMETGGAAGVFRAFVTRGTDFKWRPPYLLTGTADNKRGTFRASSVAQKGMAAFVETPYEVITASVPSSVRIKSIGFSCRQSTGGRYPKHGLSTGEAARMRFAVLTDGWKRKRRDALRRVKRWQQSTGQFRAAEQLYFEEQH